MVTLTLGRSEAMFDNRSDVPPDIPGSVVELGPFAYVSITYGMLRVADGEDARQIGDFRDGCWYLHGDPYPFSDIDIVAQSPA